MEIIKWIIIVCLMVNCFMGGRYYAEEVVYAETPRDKKAKIFTLTIVLLVGSVTFLLYYLWRVFSEALWWLNVVLGIGFYYMLNISKSYDNLEQEALQHAAEYIHYMENSKDPKIRTIMHKSLMRQARKVLERNKFDYEKWKAEQQTT